MLMLKTLINLILKSQINLYKVGDFYEVYGDEAAQASEILDIKLISKVVDGEEIQMTGFPQHVLRQIYGNPCRARI